MYKFYQGMHQGTSKHTFHIFNLITSTDRNWEDNGIKNFTGARFSDSEENTQSYTSCLPSGVFERFDSAKIIS